MLCIGISVLHITSLQHNVSTTKLNYLAAHRSDVSKAMTLGYFFCIAHIGVDNLNSPLVSVILEARSTYQ